MAGCDKIQSYSEVTLAAREAGSRLASQYVSQPFLYPEGLMPCLQVSINPRTAVFWVVSPCRSMLPPSSGRSPDDGGSKNL